MRRPTFESCEGAWEVYFQHMERYADEIEQDLEAARARCAIFEISMRHVYDVVQRLDTALTAKAKP